MGSLKNRRREKERETYAERESKRKVRGKRKRDTSIEAIWLIG
jgi:hypothetical protein